MRKIMDELVAANSDREGQLKRRAERLEARRRALLPSTPKVQAMPDIFQQLRQECREEYAARQFRVRTLFTSVVILVACVGAEVLRVI